MKGGEVYGDWPGLGAEQRFEGRDLAITTDFRDVFGEVVMRHLGADEATAAKVFPGYGVKPARSATSARVIDGPQRHRAQRRPFDGPRLLAHPGVTSGRA